MVSTDCRTEMVLDTSARELENATSVLKLNVQPVSLEQGRCLLALRQRHPPSRFELR